MKRDYIGNDIVLDRFIHPGKNPDELGTVAEWTEKLNRLRELSPLPENVQRFRLELWHMTDPRLDEERRRKIVNLEDYEPDKPGCSVAAGLNFGLKRIELGLFPQVYKVDDNDYSPIATGQIQRAMGVLSHELGHRYWHVCNLSDGTQEAQVLQSLFDELRPQQGHNIWEDFAECYRAIHGATDGTFSDGVQFHPSPGLRMFFKLLYDIRQAMNGTIDRCAAAYYSELGHVIQWRETRSQWWWPFIEQKWKAINENGQLYSWAGSRWVKS